MASIPGFAGKERASAFLSQPSLAFQRGEGDLRARKAPRRTPVRVKHIFAAFAIFAGVFYGIGRGWLFLISWDKLDVRTVEVLCGRPGGKQAVESAFRSRPLGNILLCDIEKLRSQIRSLSWVKEARIRKVFPAALRIEITERLPKAVIQRTFPVVVDEEGMEIGAAGAEAASYLSVLTDRDGFRNNRMEKLKLAWACLDELTPEEKAEFASLDFSDLGSITVRFKNDPAVVRLGDTDFGGKLRYYREHRAEWERGLGPLATIDLRFDDRVYITNGEPAEKKDIPGSGKETA